MAAEGSSLAATAAGGMAPGTAIPIMAGWRERRRLASARRRLERRLPAPTITPTDTLITRLRRRRPAATTPIRPATERHRIYRGDPVFVSLAGPERSDEAGNPDGGRFTC